MTRAFRSVIIIFALGIVGSLVIGNKIAAAMEFSIEQAPDGDRFVLAKGEIVTDDTERLRIALRSVGRNRYANKEMALDSGGGLVVEALKMVALMDQEKVSTFVLSGAMCASVCAQIVFLAGVHRMVADGGKLGIHTCAAGRDRSELCNDIIAQNAFEHGTDYGSVMAFMKYTGPQQMIWFNSKEADCYGFTLYPPEINRGKKPGEIAPCIREGILHATAKSLVLLCQGTMNTPGFTNTATETIVVDFSNQTVSAPIGVLYALTARTETAIDFSSSYKTKNGSLMNATGKIDRVSGQTTITIVPGDGPKGFFILYSLTCRPAQPAF